MGGVTYLFLFVRFQNTVAHDYMHAIILAAAVQKFVLGLSLHESICSGVEPHVGLLKNREGKKERATARRWIEAETCVIES